jgi:hypothetical protein
VTTVVDEDVGIDSKTSRELTRIDSSGPEPDSDDHLGTDPTIRETPILGISSTDESKTTRDGNAATSDDKKESIRAALDPEGGTPSSDDDDERTFGGGSASSVDAELNRHGFESPTSLCEVTETIDAFLSDPTPIPTPTPAGGVEIGVDFDVDVDVDVDDSSAPEPDSDDHLGTDPTILETPTFGISSTDELKTTRDGNAATSDDKNESTRASFDPAGGTPSSDDDDEITFGGGSASSVDAELNRHGFESPTSLCELTETTDPFTSVPTSTPTPAGGVEIGFDLISD